ncbi:MAG: recombinase zinc beta ribbon domain-containing protein, partial [Candidatus Omnitrophota bacterium]|nr:recombinase zinc beta ribbon domain-containing protein [Candidatus Omnitrophota bacterium]
MTGLQPPFVMISNPLETNKTFSPLMLTHFSCPFFGGAEGILCWKLDRLARNPIDGGTISWMLQQSVIRHIQTFQRAYHPTDNVLMMNLEFGMANQFVLDLSVNTKRGQRAKIQDGWLPHKPPVGYINNYYNQPDKPPIYPDPYSFAFMKKLWAILLEKRCSIDKLFDISQGMGFKVDRGVNLTRANFYRLFRNPFYYGAFLWNDAVYPGKHEPMITKAEFDLAQKVIDSRSFPREEKHTYAFTGLMRCGECGAFITADEKRRALKNGGTTHHLYYRCTRRIKRDCSEPPVRVDDLENQIRDILSKITIPPQFRDWAIKQLKEDQSKEIVDRDEITKAHRHNLDACAKKLDALFNMRLNEEIGPEEYAKKKDDLLREKQKYEELIGDTQARIETWLERADKAFTFAQTAQKRFDTGTLDDKRYVLSCLGSNLVLTGKQLRFQVDKSLALFQEVAPDVQSLHNRLEPAQVVGSLTDWEALYAQNKKWG